MMKPFSIVLQAGGKSTRMGTDKALLKFEGTTLLGYVLDQVATLSSDIIIISNHKSSYESFGLPLFGDVYQDWGALGGLHAAIHHAKFDLCMVLACDMPFVNIDLLRHLLGLIEKHDAVIPRLGPKGFTEPFRSVYRKTCLPPIERAIQQKKRRVNSFFQEIKVRFVDQPEIERFDPALQTFFNVNTPEDLQLAREIAANVR